jgi:hypothetical protein
LYQPVFFQIRSCSSFCNHPFVFYYLFNASASSSDYTA